MTDGIPAGHVSGYPVSAATYVKHKCRCDGCRYARARDARASRKRRAADVERDDDGHPIGKAYSSATYVNYECRCERCRAAHTATSGRAHRRLYAAWGWVQANRPDIAEQIRRETP